MAKRVAMQRWVTRADSVLVPSLTRHNVLADFISCTGRMQQQSGEGQWTVSTFVHFEITRALVVSKALGMGVAVPVGVTKTSTGYSFGGSTCMATVGDTCSNGAQQATITSIAGTIAAGSPELIDYTYTVEVFCGGVLSCVENGTCQGSRSAGTAKAFDGTWLCQQTWSISCCAARQRVQDRR